MVNQDIGRHRTEIGHDNREDVFNAIRALMLGSREEGKPRVRLEDIKKYLDEKTDFKNKEMVSVATAIYESEFKHWTRADLNDVIRSKKKKSISYRTIQRCITNDPRIKKQGWYYFIDDEARFERRYLDPSSEGTTIYREFRENMAKSRGFRKEPIENEVKNLVTEIGVFMVYTLIDACRPFRDKSLTVDDREDLVRYWIKNSIPVMYMLEEFLCRFKPDYNQFEWDEARKKDLSILEMDEESIQKTLTLLQKQYPKEFRIITDHRPRGGKRMTPFAYEDGSLVHPKKVRPR